MSVYIKGMEMPGKGEYHMTLYVCSDGSAYIDVASFPVDEDRFELVPVPPHGRLKDTDALKDYMIEGLNNMLPECRNEKQRVIMREATLAFMQDIDECPTIIPASEERRTENGCC